jgi:hypothetical protein
MYRSIDKKALKASLERRLMMPAKGRQGSRCGGLNAKGIANQQAGADFVEELRPVFDELAGLSSRVRWN